MKIYLGEEGLKKTWQKDFPKETKCYKCGGNARIMFVGCEEKEKKYVCNLHKNTGEKGGLWTHDAISIGSYLCSNCFEVTSILNQA